MITPQLCDGCTFCCKVMGVPELDKPPNMWCASCEIGVGCRNYETRPKGCVDFECAYAQGLIGADPDVRPDRAKVVFSFTTDGKYPVAYVDPQRPNAWREGPAGLWFKKLVTSLGRGFVVVGSRQLVVVADGQDPV